MVESHLDVGGAVVFWSRAEWSDRYRLKSGLELLSLDEFMPEPRQPSAALREALENTLGEPRVLVRPLASKDGFAIVREQRGLTTPTSKAQGRAKSGRIGGKATLKKHGRSFFAKIGRKGGKARKTTPR